MVEVIMTDLSVSADTAIVAFLDILGYKSIVKKMIDDRAFIKRFDDLLYEATVNVLNGLRDLEFDERDDKTYFMSILDRIRMRCIFDSVIFSLPLSDITFDSQHSDNQAVISNCLETVFSCMAYFSTFFMAKTGYPIRGGIAIGPHYESEREKYLFMFSQAHNEAVRLEASAKYPRILVQDSLCSFLKDISYPNMDKFFYKDDVDGSYCFDAYSISHIWNEPRTVLTDISKGLIRNMLDNLGNEEELDKLIYFAKYHNKKMGIDQLNYPELIININKFTDGQQGDGR